MEKTTTKKSKHPRSSKSPKGSKHDKGTQTMDVDQCQMHLSRLFQRCIDDEKIKGQAGYDGDEECEEECQSDEDNKMRNAVSNVHEK